VTTFWLAMAAIVVGRLHALAVLYGVMRLIGLVVRGVAWVLAVWLRASGRAARSAVQAAAEHVTPVRHRHRHRHAA
jgi:hypothetical protein